MKISLFLLLLTLMSLVMISNALAIDKRGEDENEPDEDEPDENEGGPPVKAQQPVKTVIEYKPAPTPVATPHSHPAPDRPDTPSHPANPSPHPHPAQQQHNSDHPPHAAPKQEKEVSASMPPKAEAAPKKQQPVADDQSETISSTEEVEPGYTYTAPTATSSYADIASITPAVSIFSSQSWIPSSTFVPSTVAETTDLPPLGIASSATFTSKPSPISIMFLSLSSWIMISFWSTGVY